MTKHVGRVFGYFETGSEGMEWILGEDGKNGYAAFVLIEKGDHLTIWNEDGTVAFAGEIIPDWKIGWAEYPYNPGRGQPCALGCWIHWTQDGWQPDDWARLFIRGDLLKAEITKTKK